MSFGFGFGFPRRLTSGGGLSPSLYLDFVGTGSLPSTVTFSRGTNATLTDSNGRIAWAPHNLLTNSEDFEAAAWTKSAATVTANSTTAPDGSVSADTLTSDGTSTQHNVSASPTIATTTSYSFSVYAKAGTTNFLQITTNLTAGTANHYANFNLQTGVVSAVGSSATATITDVGNGWYRCTAVMNLVATGTSATFILIPVDSGSAVRNPTFTTVTSVFIWGAQLNVANAPVNLLTWSEQFDNAAWIRNVSTVSANVAIAPNGTTTADKIIIDNGAVLGTSTGAGVRQQPSKAAAAITYTESVYAKAAEFNSVMLFMANGASSAGARCTFNLVTGAFSSLTTFGSGFSGALASIESVGDGWYRCVLTATSDADTALRSSVLPVDTVATTGNGVAGILVWGAQLNTGSVALPYVATTSSINLPPAYNSTTPKNLLGFTQEPENAAWTKSNSYVQQNLLTWSQDFDNAAWLKSSSTVTANTTVSPDGTTTADTVTASVGTGARWIGQQVTLSANAHSLSFFVKTDTHSFVQILNSGDLEAYANFDLGLGAVGTRGSKTTSSIQSVGNGWYRCIAVFDSTVTYATGQRIYLVPSASAVYGASLSALGTESVFIWGAQLVQGSTAGDYTQTTSAAAPTRYLNWDGTLTGRKLVENTATSTHQAYQNYAAPVTNLPLTFTVYAKAAERTKMTLYSMGNEYTYDLVAGTTSGTGTAIQSVGNGWYRCSITLPSPDTANRSYMVRLNNGSTTTYTGDGTSGIYVSDFQLSNSASVDPYVYNPQAAAASAAYYGPRFDYDPVTLASRGILIEEQRTNLLTYSEQFDNAAWTKTNATVTANAANSPDGTATADKLVENSATAQHYVSQNAAVTSGTTYAWSVFAAPAGRNWLEIQTNSAAGSISAFFDLVNGTVSNVSVGTTATISPAGGGYYRCTVSKAATSTGTGTVYFLTATGAGTSNYTGDGTSGIFIWGAQLEAGSFATSYIPTVASQVTRNADSASMLGDNFYTWYNPNQGTYFAQVASLYNVSASGTARYFIGNTAQNGYIFYTNVNDANIRNYDGVNILSTAIADFTLPNRFVSAYSGTTKALCANGGSVASGSYSGAWAALSSIGLGRDSTGSGFINGTIRRISYYNTRLPNATLQALTV